MVVSCISSPMATWSTLMALLSIHLAMNYAAVRAIRMRCLNRQRANIVFSNLLQSGQVLSPSEVARRERVFERDGVLRWSDGEVVGYSRIGVSLATLLRGMRAHNEQTGSLHLCDGLALADLLDVFAGEGYMLWPAGAVAAAAAAAAAAPATTTTTTTTVDQIVIVLKEGCTAMDQLLAWAHALSLAKRHKRALDATGKADDDQAAVAQDRLAEVRRTLSSTRALFARHSAALREAGWELEVAALETRAGTRVKVQQGARRKR